MSHPENTLKEIIQRQNEKIEGLTNIIFYMTETIYYHHHIPKEHMDRIMGYIREVKNIGS